MSTETIIVETRGRVGIIRLNRPQALNALNATLREEILAAAEAFDADAGIGCILMTGSDKAFRPAQTSRRWRTSPYRYFQRRLPRRLRAAYARAQADGRRGRGLRARRRLRARDDVRLDHRRRHSPVRPPEIKLGVMPGIGGTQRLTRAVGKAKAMDLILTGRMMDAAEAERSGLVARVVPAANLMDEAMKAAETIAAMSCRRCWPQRKPSIAASRHRWRRGRWFERRVFHALFATEDQKEGMAAFVAKRPATFNNK